MGKDKKDTQKEKRKLSVSRRDFLVTGGAVIASGALSSYGFAKGSTKAAKTGAGAAMEVEGERSIVISTGLAGLGPGGNASILNTKNGKILRLRPLHYDWKYDKKQFNPWKMEARGKTLEPRMQTLPPAYCMAYTRRVYSPNRILYPLKRVDWDPNGERNPQNRGKSKYKRISWDEAAGIVASELKRVREKYDPYAVLVQCDGHGECGSINKCHGVHEDFFKRALNGEYTLQFRNADSWEGWFWGARHVWGGTFVGLQDSYSNVIPDVGEHTDMILFWGCDPETTPAAQNGQMASRVCYWWTDIGIKSVYICPDLNYGAAVHADKWIPVRPGTDAALQLAIAYVWITEGTYDKKYLKTHAVGFDKFADYVLGKEDGIPKTPEWASGKCAVPEWTIKALAREFGSKVTATCHGNGGPGIRGPYSTENARLEVLLLAMQGLGKPGVTQIKMLEWGDTAGQSLTPGAKVGVMLRVDPWGEDDTPRMPGGAPGGTPGGAPGGMIMPGMETTKQFIPKDLIHDALLNAPISWYGKTNGIPTSDQFVKYKYPVDGCSEIHMIWSDTPCWITCWNDTNSYIKGLRSPKIETIVVQHPWMESDCHFADIILPIVTKFEQADLDADSGSGQFPVLINQRQCVKPIGEAKTHYEAVNLIAKKLGLQDKFTRKEDIEDVKARAFKNSTLAKFITYQEFMEKDYFVSPTDPEWKKYPVGLSGFYNDPDKNPLGTPSGKIEFYSERLAKYFPDDKERPPTPHWVERGVNHDERISSERAKKYPLLQVSNHPRWRMHANCDDISWTRECPTCKVKGLDGYLYEPLWMNPQDAAARGIKSGDIVKIHNERGAVLGGAYVTERIMPGAVSMDHGSRYDPIIPGELDRGGAINTISPHNTTSKNATGMAVSSYLVGVEKVTLGQMGEWRDKYPDAFERPYDPASGLCFSAVLA